MYSEWNRKRSYNSLLTICPVTVYHLGDYLLFKQPFPPARSRVAQHIYLPQGIYLVCFSLVETKRKSKAFLEHELKAVISPCLSLAARKLGVIANEDPVQIIKKVGRHWHGW